MHVYEIIQELSLTIFILDNVIIPESHLVTFTQNA